MDGNDSAAHRILVLRSQHGDRAAMEALFLRHNQALGYYLRRMLNRDEVADLQQEVWLTVLRRLHQLREPEAFTVWLYQIARRRTYTKFFERRMTPLPDSETLAESIDEPEPEFSVEDAEVIHRELGSLSESHRETVLLRFMEGLTYEQIAAVTDSNPGTVRSRLHYAKAILRKRLEEYRERR